MSEPMTDERLVAERERVRRIAARALVTLNEQIDRTITAEADRG